MKPARTLLSSWPGLRRVAAHFWPSVRKQWPLVGASLLAVVAEVVFRALEPWPLKVVFDHVFGGKQMPGWLASLINDTLGLTSKYAVLNFAALAVDGHAGRKRHHRDDGRLGSAAAEVTGDGHAGGDALATRRRELRGQCIDGSLS